MSDDDASLDSGLFGDDGGLVAPMKGKAKPKPKPKTAEQLQAITAQRAQKAEERQKAEAASKERAKEQDDLRKAVEERSKKALASLGPVVHLATSSLDRKNITDFYLTTGDSSIPETLNKRLRDLGAGATSLSTRLIS